MIIVQILDLIIAQAFPASTSQVQNTRRPDTGTVWLATLQPLLRKFFALPNADLNGYDCITRRNAAVAGK